MILETQTFVSIIYFQKMMYAYRYTFSFSFSVKLLFLDNLASAFVERLKE